MKWTFPLVKLTFIVMLCSSLLCACSKNDPDPSIPVEPPAPGNSDTIDIDALSDHLLFQGASKKAGTAPKGPSTTDLKISFEDTLYLMDAVKRPIKFLHRDITNVAGAYIQVRYVEATGATVATHYYDVPEVQDMANSDTVSVIMIGIDPTGFNTPLYFTISIIPYGVNGEPLAEASRPVKLSSPTVDPDGTADVDGLVLPAGDYWDWEMSYIENAASQFTFYNDPYKLWGLGGQDIKGSCCNGNSFYGTCPGDTVPNSVLHFNTFFTFIEETFKFFDNGTFLRFTSQFSANPEPDKSNFCGSGNGVVKERLSNVTYFGQWTVRKLPALYKGDSLSLTLKGDSSTGGGYGNPGGIIHQLDDNLMILIQPDNEVRDQDLYKFYIHISTKGEAWYPFV